MVRGNLHTFLTGNIDSRVMHLQRKTQPAAEETAKAQPKNSGCHGGQLVLRQLHGWNQVNSEPPNSAASNPMSVVLMPLAVESTVRIPSTNPNAASTTPIHKRSNFGTGRLAP